MTIRRRYIGPQPGTKSGHRPANKPLSNCGSTGRFVPPSVYIEIPLFLLPKDLCLRPPGGQKGRLSSGRTDPSASHSTPHCLAAPPCAAPPCGSVHLNTPLNRIDAQDTRTRLPRLSVFVFVLDTSIRETARTSERKTLSRARRRRLPLPGRDPF